MKKKLFRFKKTKQRCRSFFEGSEKCLIYALLENVMRHVIFLFGTFFVDHFRIIHLDTRVYNNFKHFFLVHGII